MTVLKKNPLFSASVAVCVIVFLGLSYMAISARGELKKSERNFRGAIRSHNTEATADIAPTQENVDASQMNLEDLKRQFSVASGELRKGTRLTSTDDGITVTTAIRDYIQKFQRQAPNSVDADGELVEIQLPDEFAFGFDDYYRTIEIPDDPEEVTFLSKQHQILNYTVTKLMAAQPTSINFIQRERFGAAQDGIAGTNFFTVDPAVTAAVPGAINTMAFRLKFTGSTDSLRKFFNNLNTFDLPIVVRSVEVSRAAGEGINAESEQEDAFGGLFGGSATTTTSSREPVIIGNNSEYTLILEYFEVVQPETTETVEGQS